MYNSFLDNQKRIAKENFNYFFMKMLVIILQYFFKISIALVISEIFNYVFINILVLIYIIISIYIIYKVFDYYNSIMKDIKITLNYDITYELDLKFISDKLFKKMVNYGK